MDSTVGMVSRVDVYDLCDQGVFIFLRGFLVCTQGMRGTGIERWNSSSDEANRGLETKEETEKLRGIVGPLGDWERQGHRQTSARKRDWHLSTIAIVATLAWTWTTVPRAEQNQP